MKNAKLILPCEEYLQSYFELCKEYKDNNVKTMSFHDSDTFDEWKHTIFQTYENYRNGINLPSGYVPGTTFWLVEDGEVIGVGGIRHRLTESLEKFGGHIGYGIKYSKWNKGYGTLQLKLLLEEAAKLGIRHALITCNDDNIGSARVIEKNGGKLQDIIDNVIDGQPRRTRRYWVDTPLA